MKCRLLFIMEAGPTAADDICVIEDGTRFIPAGTEIEHPQAYMLAHAGHAECVDDECREKVKEMDPAQQGAMRQVHTRIMEEMREFEDEIEEDEEDDDEEE